LHWNGNYPGEEIKLPANVINAGTQSRLSPTDWDTQELAHDAYQGCGNWHHVGLHEK